MNVNAMVRDPIVTILLGRLLVHARRPPAESDVLRSLRPLFGNADATRIDARLRAGLEHLALEGLRASDSMTLTAKGRRRASAALGIGSDAKVSWGRVKGELVQIALGRPGKASGGRSGGAKAARTAGAVRAAALASKLGLDTEATRPSEVLDAWAAREMGMANKRLTIANVRAHVLARALGIDMLRDPKRIGTVATAHVLGVPRTDASTVRDAILRDWLAVAKAKAAPDPKASARAFEPSTIDLDDFASTVKEIARGTTEGRFGRHKVFIGPLWTRARSRDGLRSLSEREFKARLVDAHRAGLLRLSRADLTPAMASDVVAASEVPYLNAVFHLVDLEGDRS